MRSAPWRREAHGKPAQSCVTAGVGGRNAAGATGRRSRRGASPPRRQGAEEDPPLRRDLPGEPLLRQLYGGWERVDGVDDADPAHTTQVNQAGAPYQCLLQNDVNLT